MKKNPNYLYKRYYMNYKKYTKTSQSATHLDKSKLERENNYHVFTNVSLSVFSLAPIKECLNKLQWARTSDFVY